MYVRGPINKGPKSKVGGPTICLPLPGPKSGWAQAPPALKVTTPLYLDTLYWTEKAMTYFMDFIEETRDFKF